MKQPQVRIGTKLQLFFIGMDNPHTNMAELKKGMKKIDLKFEMTHNQTCCCKPS
jgi:hypothetical protein